MGNVTGETVLLLACGLIAIAMLQGVACWWLFNAQITYGWLEQHGAKGLRTSLLCYLAWPIVQHPANQIVISKKRDKTNG